jgi:hypothetical protein
MDSQPDALLLEQREQGGRKALAAIVTRRQRGEKPAEGLRLHSSGTKILTG